MRDNATDGAGVHTTVIRSDQPVQVQVVEDGGHWFRMFNAIIDGGYWSRLSPSAKAVLVVLARHVNNAQRQQKDVWLAWPSVTTIRALAGLSRAATFNAISELEKDGLLKRRQHGGGATTTTYQLIQPTPVQQRGPVQLRGPLPVQQRGPHRSSYVDPKKKNEEERIENDDDAVVRMLTDIGFAEHDARQLAGHENATPEQVQTAIDNAAFVEASGKLKDRRGYIVRAIEGKHVLLDGVRRQRQRQDQRQEKDQRVLADQAARARARELERQRQARLDELSDLELFALEQRVLTDLDDQARRRLSGRSARQPGRLRQLVLEMLETSDGVVGRVTVA